MPQQAEIITTGRTDLEDFFKLHVGRRTTIPLSPFLLFKVEGLTVKVLELPDLDSLLRYPDDTKVMALWPGKWRSDYFQFTVGDYRKHLSGEHNAKERL